MRRRAPRERLQGLHHRLTPPPRLRSAPRDLLSRQLRQGSAGRPARSNSRGRTSRQVPEGREWMPQHVRERGAAHAQRGAARGVRGARASAKAAFRQSRCQVLSQPAQLQRSGCISTRQGKHTTRAASTRALAAGSHLRPRSRRLRTPGVPRASDRAARARRRVPKDFTHPLHAGVRAYARARARSSLPLHRKACGQTRYHRGGAAAFERCDQPSARG